MKSFLSKHREMVTLLREAVGVWCGMQIGTRGEHGDWV